MLDIEQIEQQYPPYLRTFKRHILREYLQYEILNIIFTTKESKKLVFLGGTALRIIHNNSRFSEDIDFDNLGLSEEEFIQVGASIKMGLENTGFQVEIRNVFKGAYHCYIRFPEILFQNNLSQFINEKILIQVDTVPQHFDYKPEKHILQRFDVYSTIQVAPKNLLLSQKIYTAFNRKTPKGRDFYDAMFLLSLGTKPDFNYLAKHLNITNGKDLQKYVASHWKKLNFASLEKDLAVFLFNAADAKRIRLFPEVIRQTMLK